MTAGRAAAAAVLAVLVIVGVAALVAASLREPARRDPAVGAELRRCRDLGRAAATDAACRRAWRESRERFLGKAERQP